MLRPEERQDQEVMSGFFHQMIDNEMMRKADDLVLRAEYVHSVVGRSPV